MARGLRVHRSEIYTARKIKVAQFPRAHSPPYAKKNKSRRYLYPLKYDVLKKIFDTFGKIIAVIRIYFLYDRVILFSTLRIHVDTSTLMHRDIRYSLISLLISRWVSIPPHRVHRVSNSGKNHAIIVQFLRGDIKRERERETEEDKCTPLHLNL